MTSALIFGTVSSSVGLELVKILLDSGRFTTIRAVDHSQPRLAFLSQGYQSCFEQVDFVQINTTSAGTLSHLY
jgi:hypothetical protein